jgi:D-arabinose 1-dehydrogenase-like Zn-dependent alcohol dehydrogenase
MVEVWSQVKDIRAGMPVTAIGFKPWEKCFWCAQGKGPRCSDLALLGYQFPEAMAEYVQVPMAAQGTFLSNMKKRVFPHPVNCF